jgi:hypothetical protein
MEIMTSAYNRITKEFKFCTADPDFLPISDPMRSLAIILFLIPSYHYLDVFNEEPIFTMEIFISFLYYLVEFREIIRARDA